MYNYEIKGNSEHNEIWYILLCYHSTMYHKLLFLVTKRNTILILYFYSLIINYNVLSNIYTKLNYFNFYNTFVIRNISVFDIYLHESQGA